MKQDMAVMDWKDAQKLRRLGFKEAEDGEHWTRHFNLGHVKAVLLVRDTVDDGFEYRTTVVNPTQKKGREQWFDARHIVLAILSLFRAWRVWIKARRALEGGLARRTLRRIWW